MIRLLLRFLRWLFGRRRSPAVTLNFVIHEITEKERDYGSGPYGRTEGQS